MRNFMAGKWDTNIDLRWLPPKILDGGVTFEPLETEGQDLEMEVKESALDSLASEQVVSSSFNTDNNKKKKKKEMKNNNNPLYLPDFCTLDDNPFIACLSSSRKRKHNLDADDATKRSGVL